MTTTHTTVENTWQGIDADHTVEVTWVYLSKAKNWVDALSDQSILADTFPFFPTESHFDLSTAEANLLANLCHWIVLQNADVLKAAFSS